MLKRFLAAAAALFAAGAFAAVDANVATQAELESIKGIGPTLSAAIIDARNQSAFSDWRDFVRRVKGVRETSASRLSQSGLTVDGKRYGAATAPRRPSAAASAVNDVKAGGRRLGHGFGELGRSVGSNAREETSALKQSARDAKAGRSAASAAKP